MKRDLEQLDDIHQKIQTIPSQLPILPVRDAVIFPNAVIPLTVGRESSVRLINDVQQGDGMLVVLTQRDKRVDAPGPGDLYDIGTVSMVHRVMKTPEGNLFVIIMGVSRTHIDEFVQFEPYLRANISVLGDEKEDESGVDFQALRRTVVSQFERIIKLSPQLPDDLQTTLRRICRTSRLSRSNSCWNRYKSENVWNFSIPSWQKNSRCSNCAAKSRTRYRKRLGRASASTSCASSSVPFSENLAKATIPSVKSKSCARKSKQLE